MPSEFVAFILALIQGLCEFLPVSSSGHLALAQAMFGLEEPEVAFDIVLHLATLLAVVFFYRRAIFELLLELKCLPDLIKGGAPTFKTFYQTRPNFRFCVFVCLASLPTAIIGLAFKDIFIYVSTSTLFVGCALLVTGSVLKISGKFSGDSGRDILDMRLKDALIIGLAQGVAITPGISRSGSTISAALILGLRRELATRFSFIVSIPAIVGALVLELRHGFDSSFSAFSFALGFATAGLSGYLALKLLVYIIKKNSFGKFAYYCWVVGLLAIAWSVF